MRLKTHFILPLIGKVILFSLLMSLTKAFELTEVKSSKSMVNEGGSVTLSCVVDGWWEWCTFKHNDNLCDFEWTKDTWNVTTLNCTEDYEFVGDYDNYECAIELTNISLEDAGKWTCEIESYYAGRYRGYGYKVTGEIDVKLTQPKRNVISLDKWIQIQIVKAIRKHGVPVSAQLVCIIIHIQMSNHSKFFLGM